VNANEPVITINGATLTEGQAMTVRIAVESFAFFLEDNGLGELGSAFQSRIEEIRALIFKP